MKRVLLLLALLNLSACSVFMAASSNDAPDLSAIGIGSHRSEVESVLGRPISKLRQGDGDIAVYQYFDGDEKSTGRAATYAVLDGLTLGLAELVTFPAEALQGNRHVVNIKYDRAGNVTEIIEEKHDAPLDKPEKILGLDDKAAQPT